MTRVHPIVQQIVEDVVGRNEYDVGDIVKHPDGYKVKIVGGQFWGEHGVSNFWYWKKVGKHGKLSKKIYNGYGWW